MNRRAPRPLDAAELRDYALRALASRSHSVAELRDKLLRRAARPGDVDALLDRLKEYGYLDDRRFAESFSASRMQNEGFGSQRALRDLGKRRVSRAVAEKAVEDTYGQTDETALIENYLGRKYRNVVLADWLAEPKHLAAAYRRLRSAGFTSSNVIRVLRRFANEPGLLDSLESAEPPEEAT